MRVTIRGKRYRLRFVRLKTHYGDCDHPTTKNKEIRITTDHENEVELLDTVVHECLHAGFPDLDEPAVLRFAKDLTRILTRLGWKLSED